MKTLKLLNLCLLVFAALLFVTAVIAFVNNQIIYGICNILWMLCEILYFSINKQSIEIKQDKASVYGFLSAMDDTIEKYGAAIITENEDGKWEIKEYLPTQHKEPSCSAENNDGIEFVHNEEGGMSDWAEQEARIACKKENPNYDFDSDEFDYGCICYKSALKAYKSLMEDWHSGMSFSFTKNILIRLMEDQPLTPITDEDFFSVERGTEAHPLEAPEYLAERGLKSHLQCPRMSSLFREETLDGKVSYHDVERAYCINIENERDTYHSWTGWLDEMFPITMPYMPKRGKYKIYEQTFLTDRKNGDFDTKGTMYVITPEGERIDVNIYRAEKDGKWEVITKEEYEERLAKRIDKN